MKLRTKTSLIVATTLVCLLVILGATARTVLMKGFTKVEHDATEKNVNRLRDAIAESVHNLSIKAADWAKWDDTHQYILDHNSDYVESNLEDESLSELDLYLMIFVDSSGNFVFTRALNAEDGTGMPVPESLLSFIKSDSLLMRHPAESSVVSGLLMTPEGPITITSRPILRSDGTGPIHGTLMFARAFDKAEIDRLAQITHLTVTARGIKSTDLPPDMASRMSTLTDSSISVAPLSPTRIAGYTMLNGVHNRPFMLARIDTPRDIYNQGQKTVHYLVIFILIAGVCFGAVILVLLERTVISRVAGLETDVRGIAKSGDHSRRVTVAGKDELASLGGSMNSMLEALERTESEVRSRNREMRMVMNTVPSGLLSLNEKYVVNPEYSKSVEKILRCPGPGCAGRVFFDMVGLGSREDDRNKLVEYLEVLHQELLPEDQMGDLNPFPELLLSKDTDGSERWIRLRYFLIRREPNEPKHTLVVVEDISEEKALAARAAESERQNMQLKAIAEDPDLFREFLGEMLRILRHANDNLGTLAATPGNKALVNEIFRDVHTIKGTAASFGLGAVSEIAGSLEDSLNPLREKGDITTEMIDATRQALGRLSAAAMEIVEQTKKILGDDVTDSGDMHLRISLAKLNAQMGAVTALLEKELADRNLLLSLRSRIAAELSSLRMVPARKGLAKALKIVPGLVRRLEKDIRFVVEGEEIPIDCVAARELNTPLVHLIRNSFDHGIEPAEDRLSSGKPEQGTVKLSVDRVNGWLRLCVSDDGRGMDPEKLRAAAVRKGVVTEAEASHMTREESLKLVFRPGFSTAERVTDVSGRGVGMDAVLTSIRDVLKGRVEIDSETGRGTTFTLAIPASAA